MRRRTTGQSDTLALGRAWNSLSPKLLTAFVRLAIAGWDREGRKTGDSEEATCTRQGFARRAYQCRVMRRACGTAKQRLIADLKHQEERYQADGLKVALVQSTVTH